MFNEIYEILGIKADIETEKNKFITRIELALNDLDLMCDAIKASSVIEKEVCYLLGEKYMGSFIRHLQKTDINATIILCKAFFDALAIKSKEYRLDDIGIITNFEQRIKQAMNQSRLDLGFGYENRNFYRKGVDEFDKPLLLEPLVWLEPYANAKRYFSEALNDYLQREYPDVITKCYSAVESIVKTICDSNKTLDHLVPDLLKRLELPEHWKAILVNYCKYAHEYASRHGKKESGKEVEVSPKDVEAYLYFTGLIIRLVIQSKNKSN